MSATIRQAEQGAPSLTDGLVTLRGFHPDTPGEADAVLACAGDPLTSWWEPTAQPVTPAQGRVWLTRVTRGWETGEEMRFAVEVGGRVVGDVGFTPAGAGLADLDYRLAPDHRGRGLMSRALRLALPWAFGPGGFGVLHWRAPVGSWAARRVAWSVGFRVERPVPGLVRVGGRRVDGWLAGLRAGSPQSAPHPWYEPVRVTGRGVVLRELRDEDVPRIVEACRDPGSLHWLPGLPAEYGEREAHEHLAHVRAEQAGGRGVHWAVADPDDDRIVAQVAVFVRDFRDLQGEIGYWAHPAERRRGVVTEAVRMAVRHALLPQESGGLGLHRVALRAAEGNIASRRVAEKAGFTLSGRDRGADLLRDGTRVDDVRYDLLAAELPAVR